MSYHPTILVTGFEPFLGRPKNASWEAVSRLPDQVLGSPIVRRQLPVVWFDCVEKLEALIEEHRPRAVISVGEGYPYPPIMIERLGKNICFGPDNTGVVDLYEVPVYSNGPAAYFSTFPYEAMHRRLKEENIPVRYSFDAGQNQCNCILYSALHMAATRFPGMLAGFIHVPMLPGENIQGMDTETTARALLCCLEETVKYLCPPVRTLDQCREAM